MQDHRTDASTSDATSLGQVSIGDAHLVSAAAGLQAILALKYPKWAWVVTVEDRKP